MAASNSATFRSQWTSAIGYAIHYRESTIVPRFSQPAVVLVPGLGMSCRYMMPLGRALAPHYRVLALELPGFGRSEKPPSALSLRQLADALGAWLEAMQLETPILMGNSMGCQVIVDLAVRKPHLVGKAILHAPTVDRHRRSGLEQFLRLLLDGLQESPGVIFWVVWDYLTSGIGRVLTTLRFALEDQPEEKLPRVQAPTLVVYGTRDPLISQVWAEEVAGLLPHGRLEAFPRGTHAMNYSMPEHLLDAILRFLQTENSRPHSPGSSAVAPGS